MSIELVTSPAAVANGAAAARMADARSSCAPTGWSAGVASARPRETPTRPRTSAAATAMLMIEIRKRDSTYPLYHRRGEAREGPFGFYIEA